jgi:hypothetical protein
MRAAIVCETEVSSGVPNDTLIHEERLYTSHCLAVQSMVSSYPAAACKASAASQCNVLR